MEAAYYTGTLGQVTFAIDAHKVAYPESRWRLTVRNGYWYAERRPGTILDLIRRQMFVGDPAPKLRTRPDTHMHIDQRAPKGVRYRVDRRA